MKLTKPNQMSESLTVAFFLAMSGGFLDAYTFLCRGGVFANAQTGNIVLLGISLARFDFRQAGLTCLPILAYAIGIVLSNVVRVRKRFDGKLHWRQYIVLTELLAVAAVSFIPDEFRYNGIVAILIAVTCSLQVESFRDTKGHNIVTTMCTGNLRNASVHLLKGYLGQDPESARVGGKYLAYISIFVLGAFLGAVCTNFFGTYASLVACGLLAVVFCLMFVRPKPQEVISK